MNEEIQSCSDLAMLIDFIEKCRKVCAEQKELARKADFLHNQALDGIKQAKKRIKEIAS